MRLAEIKAHTVDTSIEILGEQVAVKLRPTEFTSQFEAETNAAMSVSDSKAMAGLLARLVSWIDIIDDNGNPIACDADTFYTVIPIDVMAELWQAVGLRLRPGKAKAETSDAG